MVKNSHSKRRPLKTTRRLLKTKAYSPLHRFERRLEAELASESEHDELEDDELDERLR